MTIEQLEERKRIFRVGFSLAVLKMTDGPLDGSWCCYVDALAVELAAIAFENEGTLH